MFGARPTLFALVLACGPWEGDAPPPTEVPPAEPAAPPAKRPVAGRPDGGPAPRVALERARADHQRLVDRGGWPIVAGPVGPTSPPGAIEALSDRLVATEDLEAPTSAWTPALAQAVARFQERHGLDPDGVVGPATQAALAVPAEQRLAELDANLRAWDALHVDDDGAWVVVNVPEFVLRAYEGDDEVLSMRVVVGDEFDGRATPSFTSAIDQVVFRPYWMIPESIATEELVPRARRDPDGFLAEGFELVPDYYVSSRPVPATEANLARLAAGDLRARQRPGPTNALGRVKFLFPSEQDIYLHDTPERALFARPDRAASHGCVRLEDPEGLARLVLRHGATGWSRAEVEAAMNTGPAHQVVRLERPVPVVVGYFTAWVDEDGTVRFSPDLYGRIPTRT